MTRETIYEAVFQFMKNGVGAEANTFSRRPRLWSDVSSAEQPAIFQAQVDEEAGPSMGHGMPIKWTLRVEWYVYVSAGNDVTQPTSSLLNPILDILEALFPPVGKAQTLDGLVYEVRIAGRIRIAEMSLGAQAVALVPIRIIVSV